jgi:hypothetical protein
MAKAVVAALASAGCRDGIVVARNESAGRALADGYGHDLLITGRLGSLTQPTMLMEPSRVMQRVFQAEGVVDGSRELDRLTTELERLIRKAKVPQSQRQVASVRDPSILADTMRPKRCPLPIVELSERSCAAFPSTGEIPSVEPSQALQEKSFHQDARIVEALGKEHGFVGQFPQSESRRTM